MKELIGNNKIELVWGNKSPILFVYNYDFRTANRYGECSFTIHKLYMN